LYVLCIVKKRLFVKINFRRLGRNSLLTIHILLMLVGFTTTYAISVYHH